MIVLFVNLEIQEAKYIVATFFGLILIYDFMKFLPYYNKWICVSYGALALIFEYTTILLALI